MQLAVLEGRLSPQEVGLYWVNQAANGAANVETVTVNEDATLQNWRPDVFEKEQELAQRIMALRWQQGSGS
jgi:predicted ATPase